MGDGREEREKGKCNYNSNKLKTNHRKTHRKTVFITV